MVKIIQPAFRRRYVAFLDVLGFEQLVFQADTKIEARRTVRRAISILRSANNDRRNSGYQFTHFSDSIVLSADLTNIGARAVMESCTRLSQALLERGLLLRGGLTAGKIIHNEGMLYGSGMIEAYRLDQRGLPPRISITDDALAMVRTQCTSAFVERYVTQDDYDLSPMVHTLQELAREGRRGAKVDKERIERGRIIASQIGAEAINLASLPDVRAKWRWLRTYWNRSMAPRGLVELVP